jgi:hypothetical protein
MSQTASTARLDPSDVAGWAAQPFETLFALSLPEVEEAQLQALAGQFERLRGEVSALGTLASKEGIERVESVEQAAPLLFDHRVYKSYPFSLIEKRQFDRLTTWLRRLTSHDLTAIPLDGVRSVDQWIERLDEHGMIIIHSTGTSGKLSFFPRSRDEWPAWANAFFESTRAASGVDRRTERLPTFYPSYRYGHTTGTKMQRMFSEVSAEGEEGRYCLYEYKRSSDLLSMAARLREAEERGELDQLDLDPELLEERAKLIEAGRHRDEDLDRWFTKLSEEFRGQKVRVTGVTADLIQLALKGRDRGMRCEFAPGSVLFAGGGMKGLRDVPDDWEAVVKDFYGIDRFSSMYAMTESMGFPPLCTAGYYHFWPYTIPIVLDPDGNVLPREGAQTGRLALFDLLAQTYWGGIITGDRITMHWDEECPCGWKGPRIEPSIARFSQLEGGDDKISCAGTEDVYSEFMDYVSRI